MSGREVKCIKCNETFIGSSNNNLTPCPKCGYRSGIPVRGELPSTPTNKTQINTSNSSQLHTQKTLRPNNSDDAENVMRQILIELKKQVYSQQKMEKDLAKIRSVVTAIQFTIGIAFLSAAVLWILVFNPYDW